MDSATFLKDNISTVYVRVKNKDDYVFKMVNNLIDIFEGGEVEIVFYEKDISKYYKCCKHIYFDKFIIDEFLKIISFDDLVLR